MTGLKTVLAAMIAAASLSACGTLAGAAVGGAAGAAIGNNTGNGDAESGAAIGAAAGAIPTHLALYHFDPYSVAFRFIARGDEPDYHLVLTYLQHGWMPVEERQ